MGIWVIKKTPLNPTWYAGRKEARQKDAIAGDSERKLSERKLPTEGDFEATTNRKFVLIGKTPLLWFRQDDLGVKVKER